MHFDHVLLAVAWLREQLRADKAWKWLLPVVFSHVVLEVAHLIEFFAATRCLALVVDPVSLGCRVTSVLDLDPFVRNVIQARCQAFTFFN